MYKQNKKNSNASIKSLLSSYTVKKISIVIFFGILIAELIFLIFLNKNHGLEINLILAGEFIVIILFISLLVTVISLIFLKKLILETEQNTSKKSQRLEKLNQQLKSEITARKIYENQLEKMLHYDPLTELPSKNLFSSKTNLSISKIKTTKKILGVMLIQINEILEISDAYGSVFANILLKKINEILSHFKKIDTIARHNQNQLILLTKPLNSSEELQNLSKAILYIFSKPLTIENKKLSSTINIGISYYPNYGKNSIELFYNAFKALNFALMNNVKYKFYHKSIEKKKTIRTKHSIMGDLPDALKNKQFELFFQPKINLKNNKPSGAEALIRWNHPQKGIIPPDKFIYLAENTGIIKDIGEWIIKQSCIEAKKWQKIPELQNIGVAVNLSSIQFSSEDIVKKIQHILTILEYNPSLLEVEITETTIIQDFNQATRTLNELHKIGVITSIDDFGTGYSSINYLKKFHTNKIKIDKSFVQKLTETHRNQQIIKGIINLSHGLDMKVIAEGIENNEQLTILKKLGCDEGQGYLFSKPINYVQIIEFYKQFF